MSPDFRILAAEGVWAAVERGPGRLLEPVSDWPRSGGDEVSWLVLGVSHGPVKTLWRAVDFDNKAADPAVGGRIVFMAERMLARLRASGRPGFRAASRSAAAQPAGQGSHLFVWLPDMDPSEQERYLLDLLAAALDHRPEDLTAARRAAHGLDGNLHLFFPPGQDVGAQLSVAALPQLGRFRRNWREFLRAGTKKL